jgi:cytochrome P450
VKPEIQEVFDNPLDLGHFREPFALEHPQVLWKEIRDEAPYLRTDACITLFRFADCAEVNRRPEVLGFGGALGDEHLLGSPRPLIPEEIDGPEHKKYRRLLDPMFAPRVMGELEESLTEMTNELIDRFIARGEVELYEEYCKLVPAIAFLRLMGLPLDDLEFFLAVGTGIIGKPEGDTPEERLAFQKNAGLRLEKYINEALDDFQSRSDPPPGLLLSLLRAEIDGQPLPREVIIDISYLLVLAGLETVSSALSLMVAWLALHPAEQAEVASDLSIIPEVVEELMRLEAPTPRALRRATTDITLKSGIKIHAGELIQIWWGIANLDPEAFPDPLKVDFQRKDKHRHLSFANGFHRCLGSHLARLELKVGLAELSRRIPEYAFQPGEEPVFRAAPARHVEYLPLVFTPQPARTPEAVSS